MFPQNNFRAPHALSAFPVSPDGESYAPFYMASTRYKMGPHKPGLFDVLVLRSFLLSTVRTVVGIDAIRIETKIQYLHVQDFFFMKP